MFKKLKDWIVKQGMLLNKFVVKNWFLIINYIVIFVSYSNVYGNEELVGIETLLGLWIFTSIAYAGFKWFMKKK